MERKKVEYCCICRADVVFNNKINIKLTTTQHSQINLEEFIKESILEVKINEGTTFNTNYVCQGCCDLINELENYFIKYKHIQQSLINTYLTKKALEHSMKYEELDVRQVSKQELDESSFKENTEIQTPNEIDTVSISTTKVNVKQSKVKKKCKEAKRKICSKRKHRTNQEENGMEKERFCCEICGQQYDKVNAFKIHLKTHKNQNLFNCDYCKKSFTQKVGLKRHLPIHTGEFPFKCDMCDKQFVHHTSYNLHKRTHLGIRDHQCEFCGLALICKSHLKRHMKTHTSEKKFGCSTCGRMFAERYNLIAHMKVHIKQEFGKDPISKS